MPKGSWRRDSDNGGAAVTLCPPTVGFAGGACFNDARVEVDLVGQSGGASLGRMTTSSSG